MSKSNSSTQILLSVIAIAVIIVVFVGVTFSFFNYTRTGAINNLGTGRIYFNSSQSNTLNITNVFPMTSSEANEANLDSVTISITGDTTYTDGEEFEISIVNVTNTLNGKKIPINYNATYTRTASGDTIGSSSNDYWNARNSKNASIYTLNAEGQVKEGKQVLVGYIDNGATGINGNLTISAYIDASRIAITDTYPAGEGYALNTNMSSTQLNYCIGYLEDIMDVEHHPLPTGHTLEAFCSGTGTLEFDPDGFITFQELLDNNDELDFFYDEDLEYLEENGVISYANNGTTSEWVDGRVVLTTSEWNSLANTPISFKIRAESNEGIWVEEPHAPTMEEMCPGCVFTYLTTSLWTTWNTDSETPTVLTSSDYEENYEDVITSSGKNFFLGLKLNGSNQIEKAYVCGLYNDETPFCIEGYYDDSKYEANQEILQNEYLWNNTCSLYDEGTIDEFMYCEAPSTGLVDAYAESIGNVVGVGGGSRCRVVSDGIVGCSGAGD